MCPWCYIGWGNLRQALQMLEGEIAAEPRWHAFELNPEMPEEGEDRVAHIARKYGRTEDQAKAVQGQMKAAAQAAGVSLDYEGQGTPPPAMMWNTFAAHRLLAWAGEEHGAARQTELKLSLFSAHFNYRRPVGKRDELIAIAREKGFDPAETAAAFEDEAFAHKVRAEERAAWDLNITGVPAMIVENRFMIPGAQPPEGYVTILRRVVEKTA